MLETTIEEASKCPKCGQTGETVTSFTNRAKRYNRAYIIECKNEKCTWFETRYVVQADSDGNVPIRDETPTPTEDKIAPPVSQGYINMGQAEVEQLAAEPKEIRSPYSPN